MECDLRRSSKNSLRSRNTVAMLMWVYGGPWDCSDGIWRKNIRRFLLHSRYELWMLRDFLEICPEELRVQRNIFVFMCSVCEVDLPLEAFCSCWTSARELVNFQASKSRSGFVFIRPQLKSSVRICWKPAVRGVLVRHWGRTAGEGRARGALGSAVEHYVESWWISKCEANLDAEVYHEWFKDRCWSARRFGVFLGYRCGCHEFHLPKLRARTSFRFPLKQDLLFLDKNADVGVSWRKAGPLERFPEAWRKEKDSI